MKKLSAWFDDHPKTRIALQLMLDGPPVFLALIHILSGYTIGMYGSDGTYHFQTSWLYHGSLACLLVLSVPAFVAGFIWHDREGQQAALPRWCRWLSVLLRACSAVIVTIVLLIDMMFVVYLLST